MESISITPALAQTNGATPPKAFAELGSDDFLRLLIMQLRNQDPMEPMGNDELLGQIASMRDIELSTTLTDSLRSLTSQRQFASTSSLIGQFVTGTPGEDGSAESGMVVGVRFTADGQPILELANGSEFPVDRLSSIEPPLRAAEALIGKSIVGVDGRDPTNPEVVEGVVTAVRIDEQGEVMLELDSGQNLRFRDFVALASAAPV